MPDSFGFFVDPGLSARITVDNPITAIISVDGTRPTVDRVIYLGSPTAGRRIRAAVPNIRISITNPAGWVMERLALSSAGLDAAINGAELDTGVSTLLGGAANALPIHVRFLSATATGTSTVAFRTSEVMEDAAP